MTGAGQLCVGRRACSGALASHPHTPNGSPGQSRLAVTGSQAAPQHLERWHGSHAGSIARAAATHLSPILGKLVWVQVPEAHWPLQYCPPGHTPPHWSPREHLVRQYLSPVFGQLVWMQVYPVVSQTPVLRAQAWVSARGSSQSGDMGSFSVREMLRVALACLAGGPCRTSTGRQLPSVAAM